MARRLAKADKPQLDQTRFQWPFLGSDRFGAHFDPDRAVYFFFVQMMGMSKYALTCRTIWQTPFHSTNESCWSKSPQFFGW